MNKKLPIPNIYGQAIIKEFKNNKGHIQIAALAGTGKTTILLQLCHELNEAQQRNTLVVAFSKNIQTTMMEKLPSHINCKTIHSLGMKILSEHNIKTEVKNDKYKNILRDKLTSEKMDFNIEENNEYLSILYQTLKMCQLTLIEPDNDKFVEELGKYDIKEYPDSAERIKWALDYGSSKEGLLKYGMSFEDMLWLPIKYNLNPSAKYKNIMVDECQDLSNALIELIFKYLENSGRIVAVGDKYQAIFGFAFANPESYDNLRKTLNARELPLSICYRCPQQHIVLAQKIVPEIEGKPNNPSGFVKYFEYDEALEELKEFDFVICRRNAPLITLAFNLIKINKNVTISGRSEITTQIHSSVKAILGKKKFDKFPEILRQWHDNELSKLLKKTDPELQIANLQDKVDCMTIIYDKAIDNKVKNLTGFKKFCDNLFPDKNRAVKLMSVHKCKGLENDRVFILDYKHIKLPLKQPWQQSQESNLKYVAYTRSKNYLGLINLKE